MADVFPESLYNGSVAVPIPKGKSKSFEELTPTQQAAVRLMAAGKSASVVARMLVPHVYPKEWAENPSYAKRLMRKRVRAWEESQWFRDLVYNHSMIQLDADLPAIMRGMSRRARKRVDAARLVLEVTGRHNPRGEQAAPSEIHISFGGQVPRPPNRPQIDDGETVEAEVLEEEDEV